MHIKLTKTQWGWSCWTHWGQDTHPGPHNQYTVEPRCKSSQFGSSILLIKPSCRELLFLFLRQNCLSPAVLPKYPTHPCCLHSTILVYCLEIRWDLPRVVLKMHICLQRPVFYIKWYQGAWSPCAFMFLFSLEGQRPSLHSPSSLVHDLRETQYCFHYVQPAHCENKGPSESNHWDKSFRGGKGLEEERLGRGLEINQPVGQTTCEGQVCGACLLQ